MYVTAILMLLLLTSLAASERKGYNGLHTFDRSTTLPLRGMLALLIVAHHLGQKSHIPLLSGFTSGIGMQIVAVFFFISGYGLCKSFLAKGESYLDGFIHNRLGKLLPKFIILTGGMMLIYHFFSSMDIGVQAVKMAHGWTPLPNSWFIYVIIYVYVAFYLCASITKKPLKVGVLFTLAIIAYMCVASMVLHFPGWWYFTVISVNAGYFVALYEEKATKFLSHSRVSCTVLALLLFVLFCVRCKINRPPVSYAMIEIWLLAVAVSVYAIVRALGMMQWSWLCKVGEFSLELYLVHGIPLMIGQYIGLHDWGLWIFTYALSIASAILMSRAYDIILRGRPVRA